MNPRKVWLLYARRLYTLLLRHHDEMPGLVRKNLERAAVRFGLRLDPEQTERLVQIALAFLEEEYMEAYRRASRGEEPETKLSALETSAIVAETLGYPVTSLLRKMSGEIAARCDEPEERVVEELIRKFGAYPAQAILDTDLRELAIPENHVPDYCLALAVQSIIERDRLGRRD